MEDNHLNDFLKNCQIPLKFSSAYLVLETYYSHQIEKDELKVSKFVFTEISDIFPSSKIPK